MEKNIKIVTFQRAQNYGAFLQAYALCNKLKNMGYNAKIVDYQNKNIDTKKPNKLIKPNLKWTLKSIYEYAKYHKKLNKKFSIFTKLIEKELPLTSKITNINDFEKIIDEKDILITGSDQVWNPIITKGVDNVYTLNVKKENVKKISYAPSIGNIDNLKNFEDIFFNNISNIDHISIREKSSKEFLEKKMNNKMIFNAIDPTLLLRKEEWDKTIEKINTKKIEDYILAYDVAPNEDYLKIVNHLSNETGLKVIHFDLKNIYKNVLENRYIADPFEFVSLIKNAKYVVTTSFHATVFSIIYNKKFIVVPHKQTGKRVTDLLDELYLSNRYVFSFNDFKIDAINKQDDYEKIELILNEMRDKSTKWLKQSIDD